MTSELLENKIGQALRMFCTIFWAKKKPIFFAFMMYALESNNYNLNICVLDLVHGGRSFTTIGHSTFQRISIEEFVSKKG